MNDEHDVLPTTTGVQIYNAKDDGRCDEPNTIRRVIDPNERTNDDDSPTQGVETETKSKTDSGRPH